MIAIPKTMADIVIVHSFLLTPINPTIREEAIRKIATIANCPTSNPMLNASRGWNIEASLPSKDRR